MKVGSISLRCAGLALAIPEPFGVMGVVASDDQPLLGLLSMILPCIAQATGWLPFLHSRQL